MFIGCIFQYCRDINSPQMDLQFQSNTIQNPHMFILCRDELDKLMIKYIWEVKGLRKKTLKNKIK